MRAHRTVQVSATAAIASALVAISIPGPAGAQDTPPCPPLVDYCVPVEDEEPPASGNGGGGGEPDCIWTEPEMPGNGGNDLGALPEDPGPMPSPESVLLWEICDGEYTGNLTWWTPAEPEPPAALAMRAFALVAGRLPDPQVTASPAGETPAIIGFPSFVHIDNWTGTVRDQACDPVFPLCVTVTAEPTLVWAPGEPAAGQVSCSGPGTIFDPEGPDPETQAAAPGACTYAYRTRTGVDDRPAEWPGVVSVTWTLTWSATNGETGTLPDVTHSTDLPRAVDEVQTVVESAG